MRWIGLRKEVEASLGEIERGGRLPNRHMVCIMMGMNCILMMIDDRESNQNHA